MRLRGTTRFLPFGLLAASVVIGCLAVEFSSAAQGAGQRVLRGAQGAAPGAGQTPAAETDSNLVAQGRELFQTNCSFCHGIDARGGAQGGPDLVTSQIVRQDVDAKQLGAFVRVGRPDKGMPAFNLSDSAISQIAAFLHAQIAAAGNVFSFGRGGNPNVILVGDAKAGEAYFKGAGGCTQCHSVSGDLKGIGSKYDPRTLQNSMVLPRGRGGFFPQANKEVPIKVTVTPKAGKPITGALVSISDFDVTLIDDSGVRRTFARDGDVPKVTLEDPLQGHIALLSKLTDKDIHDLTAYLVTLK